MRPPLLDPLFASPSSLPKVGPKIAALLSELVASQGSDDERIIDLVFHLPHALIDRRQKPGISRAPQGSIVTVTGRVDRHQPPPRGSGNVPYRVFLHDETGELALVFFRAKAQIVERQLPLDATVTVSGKIDWFNGRASMVHPDYVALDADDVPSVEPVYGLTAGLSPKLMRRIVEAATERVPDLPEWLDGPMMQKHGFSSFRGSILALHHPRDAFDVDLKAPARRRLALDELLAGQLSLALVRQKMRKDAGRPIVPDGSLQDAIRAALPFSPTASQTRAIEEIFADMRRPERMLRLLQGDVGAGKTLVALMAIAGVIESGGQAVLMAPTEILARQHYETISRQSAHTGLKIEVLTGRTKGKEREESLARIASGQAQLVIGTHALFQDSVAYKDLMLAVVDEQHRFGVHQRLRLTEKGITPHMLVMTATPIPRTLVLAAFGDLDVSKLTEKPAGRQPIQTVTIPDERLEEVIGRLKRAVQEGKKAYWVCPLVEEAEDSDLVSAEERFHSLKDALGPVVGLVHGRMNGADKDLSMEAFKSGQTRVLVATTVVEVGVDVPDASIMVIEHAERFGLSQLHQLRGRIGRGSEASTCILLYKGPLGQNGHARLSIMRDTEDGFRIAEEDLKLRGEGEILGTRQSGTPGFRLANLDAHADLLEIARKDAAYILTHDPDLSSERGRALRLLLYIFRRNEAIRFLGAG